jgi:hypothetical protein
MTTFQKAAQTILNISTILSISLAPLLRWKKPE